ncbi:hypothetical protein M8J76_004395 [Diaphorina citri]|nr:hypothetical protein M8J76_004395 [Diaphorina citri]
MEADVSQDQDFQDYWNEYRILQETKRLDEFLDEQEEAARQLEDEGEQEAEWLSTAGLSQLSDAYRSGLEIPDADLSRALRHLSSHQAQAVRRRVLSLNHTLRQRGARQLRPKNRKPDIRHVFKDVENND